MNVQDAQQIQGQHGHQCHNIWRKLSPDEQDNRYTQYYQERGHHCCVVKMAISPTRVLEPLNEGSITWSAFLRTVCSFGCGNYRIEANKKAASKRCGSKVLNSPENYWFTPKYIECLSLEKDQIQDKTNTCNCLLSVKLVFWFLPTCSFFLESITLLTTLNTCSAISTRKVG